MTTTMPESVAAARDLVSPAIAGWLERLSPEVRMVAAYHLGFVDADGVATSVISWAVAFGTRVFSVAT